MLRVLDDETYGTKIEILSSGICVVIKTAENEKKFRKYESSSSRKQRIINKTKAQSKDNIRRLDDFRKNYILDFHKLGV